MGEKSPYPASNPFSPGFGKVPASLVGRDEILSDLHAGLAVGPSDERYASVVLGVRGSGKTVVLTAIEDHAASSGWIVLSVDGTTPGLLDRISQMIGQASREYESLDIEGFSSAKSKTRRRGIKVGPYSGERSEQQLVNEDMSLRERLTILARIAHESNTGVLLTVDELQAADADEARRLASDLQHIANRAVLPLAFVGAGLMELKYTLMEGKKNTFFKRCNAYELPPLDEAEALRGIDVPIRDAGGRISRQALRYAARAVGGSPYKLQLIGHRAWTIGGAPSEEIDEFAVEEAVALAEDTVVRNISEPAFYDLSNDEQGYLEALVQQDRPTTKRISALMGVDAREARRIARRLSLAGYITIQENRPVLTGLVPREVILAESESDVDDLERPVVVPNVGYRGDFGSRPGTKCREWMPRAKAYCVLPANHAGRCRSRSRVPAVQAQTDRQAPLR